jgi:uncharacterized RDD family membrane protein YckC
MAQISINTSQNVQIEHPIANVGVRILSQLLDYVFIFAYVMFVLFIISGLLEINDPAIIIIAMLPAFFYSFITESIFHGQSFAKMILGVKVVKLDGSQATLLNYFVRWMFRIIDTNIYLFFGAIAIISIAVSSKGQRLGDKAAGTIVVSLKKKYNFRNMIYRRISDNHKLQFPQVEQLTENDVNTINEVINHYYKNPGMQSRQLLIKTKEAIIKKTGIDTQLESIPFLRTIVKDYNYILRDEEY